MAQIKPFRALHYDLTRVNLDDVTTPPYDVISPEEQEQYYRLSPYNMIRLDLGKTYPSDSDGDNRYTRAAKDFTEWQKTGVLIADPEPAIYVYRQTFEHQTRRRQITGMIALVKLEELGEGILPHEKTLSGPKQDRRRLLEACRANFSQIFALYSDGGEVKRTLAQACRGAPGGRTADADGVTHEIWPLTSPASVKAIAERMLEKRLLIADGHHRYETALNFSKDMRAAGESRPSYDYVMMYLVDAANEDLLVLPTHRILHLGGLDLDRLLKDLPVDYRITDNADLSRLASENRSGDLVTFGLYAAGRPLLLSGNRRELAGLVKGGQAEVWKRLDTALLQETILSPLLGINSGDSRLSFTQSADKAIAEVDQGRADLAILLEPMDMKEVVEVAEAGEKMSQKSTYFYPKPRTGLVIYKFSD